MPSEQKPPSPPPSGTFPPATPTPPFPAPRAPDADSATRPGERPIEAFRRRVQHLRAPLHALLSVATGTAHPAFPRTLLHYHVLTEAQLDALAAFYHQAAPEQLSWAYPAPVAARWGVANAAAGVGPAEDKRRRFGRFIGLRGCESPTEDGAAAAAAAAPLSEAERAAHEESLRLLQAAIERWVDYRVETGVKKAKEIDNWRTKGW